MSTLLGIGLFSAIGALIAGRLYDLVVGTGADGIASVGRWVAFSGTWTGITAAFGMRGMSNSVAKFRKRGATARKLVEHTKDK